MPSESPAVDEDRQEWTAYEVPFQAPAKDELVHLAHRILGLTDDTRARMLDALRDGPLRYSELESRLGAPAGRVVRALQNLQRDGLVVERVNARQRPATKLHQLTLRGELVLEYMDRCHAIVGRPVEVQTAKGTYVLYSRPARGSSRRRVFFLAPKGQPPPDGRPESLLPGRRIVVASSGEPRLE